MNNKKSNSLIHETSPYLLQHAYNPVAWYAWGEEALERAKKENKPILLSIGYSACHWCHVMEKESFENERIAAIMNEHYICIKVDREERPDLDSIYMAATTMINQGHGGWPMTVFLTPEQKPFFAGTYFPPEDKYGSPGFPSILQYFAKGWKNDPAALLKQSELISEELYHQFSEITESPLAPGMITQAIEYWSRTFDNEYGGFGGAPKFPPCTTISLLLRYYQHTKNENCLQMATVTLDAMANGGIFDHVGGGFARYSVDRQWLVPHFEKMLYDNAQLVQVYLEAYQVTHNENYRHVAERTLDFILKEMTSPDGGFYSSIDADSEGEEGKFYVWTIEEIHALLEAKDALRFCSYYNITSEGNWERKNIPNTPKSKEKVAQQLNISTEDLSSSLSIARQKLYNARSKRIAPETDDKILTSWNALMISAMAEASRVLGEKKYFTAAIKATDFILNTLSQNNGKILRTFREGRAHIDGFLEDYAYLAVALIDLYEAGADELYLKRALQLCEIIRENFLDNNSGAFFSTAKDQESLYIRHREGNDNATPSANALAVQALTRLSWHYDRKDLRNSAFAALSSYGQTISRHPFIFASSLSALDFHLQGQLEISLVGDESDDSFRALQHALGREYLPNRIISHCSLSSYDEESGRNLPLLQGKKPIDRKGTVYLCYGETCQDPITTIEQLAVEIKKYHTYIAKKRG